MIFDDSEEVRYLLDATVFRNIAAEDSGYQNILLNMLKASHVELSAIAAAENFKAVHNHKLTRAERAVIEGWMRKIKVATFGEEAGGVGG